MGEARGGRHGRVVLACLLGMGLAGLVGCGGGGGAAGADVATPPTTGDTLVASSSVQGRCRAPRAATVLDEYGRPYGDLAGTLRNELDWVRAWIDETYLWYGDVRDLPASTRNPANYSDPVVFFDALKSGVTTASGRPRDQFHFTYDTPEWVSLIGQGLQYGYGMTVVFSGWSRPRSAVVALTDPGSVASAAGITRGEQIVAVDGVDLANGSDEWAIYEGLYPSQSRYHELQLRHPLTGVTRRVSLLAAPVTLLPVRNVRTLPAPHTSVGYLQFDDHIATAEPLLVQAFSQLAAAGVTDLVLDLRYNGGGLLDLAAQVAYMVAGPSRTRGQVFERLQFNDRNPAQFSNVPRDTPFHSQTQGFSGPAGQALPTLNLGRVYVLSSASTCSASESIINGLRGVGVQVVQVGGTTCGKPYGFFPTDNCGTTYFAVQFKGVNALGFGDYADGLAPTCTVNDDFANALGDPAEGMLATALTMRATGRCQAVASGKAQAQAAERGDPGLRVLAAPWRHNRWLTPQR